MNKQDWEKVHAVFELALNANESDRAEIIDRELRDEPNLAEKVRKLLAEDAADSTFGGADAAATVLNIIDGLPIDEKVGRYRITKRLGEGGMGSVYLAERSDDTFEKQVALKLIRGDLSEQALERFSIERQALAQLEHPNIARLLDGGVDERSRPYVAMEYVDGLPITHHCDKQRLSINDRIELFIDLCDAIQHAHRNLIVHRDIKPSNVLVTSEGTVKLLDFGIAKLLGPGQQQALTATAARVLTPDYASPEQVTGEAITTATDVYQLGVLLYELLCGLRPLDTGQLTPSQFEAALLKGDITAPSRYTERLNENTDRQKLIAKLRNVSTERLSQSLKGDLDVIVKKAMAPEASQRYASPTDFAADLQRYLDGLPILARPASRSYRFRKFVGRNRVAVSLATSAFVLMVLFALFSLEQARQTREQRDLALVEKNRAEQEARRAEAVSNFLSDTLSNADPRKSLGEDMTVVQFLDEAAESVNDLLGEQPEAVAKVLTTMARSYQGLGSYRKAFQTATKGTFLCNKVEELICARARNIAANSANWLGRTEVAKQNAAQVLLLSGGEFDSEKAFAFRDYGLALADEGNLRGGGELLRLASEMFDDAYGKDSPDSVLALHLFGKNRFLLNLQDEAVVIYEEAMSRETAAGRGHSTELAKLKLDLGKVLQHKDLDRATKLTYEGIEHFRQVFGPNHVEYARYLSNLSGIHKLNGNQDERIQVLKEAIFILEEQLGAHQHTASAHYNFANLYLEDLISANEARLHYSRSVEIGAQVLPDSTNTAYYYAYYAHFLRAQDECEIAVEYFAEAERIYSPLEEYREETLYARYFGVLCEFALDESSVNLSRTEKLLADLGNFFGTESVYYKGLLSLTNDR